MFRIQDELEITWQGGATVYKIVMQLVLVTKLSCKEEKKTFKIFLRFLGQIKSQISGKKSAYDELHKAMYNHVWLCAMLQ